MSQCYKSTGRDWSDALYGLKWLTNQGNAKLYCDKPTLKFQKLQTAKFLSCWHKMRCESNNYTE